MFRRPDSPVNSGSVQNLKALEALAVKLKANKAKVNLVYREIESPEYTTEKLSLDAVAQGAFLLGKSLYFGFSPGPMKSAPATWAENVGRLGCTPQWQHLALATQTESLSGIEFVMVTHNSLTDLTGNDGLLAVKSKNMLSALVLDQALIEALEVPMFKIGEEQFPNVRGGILMKPDGSVKVFPLSGPVTPEKMLAHLADLSEAMAPEIAAVQQQAATP